MPGMTVSCYVPLEWAERLRQQAAKKGMVLSKYMLLAAINQATSEGANIEEVVYNDYERWQKAVRLKKGTTCEVCNHTVEGVLTRPLDPDAPLTVSNSLCACIPCFSQNL